MEKEFIPYEQALALKELGFDAICFATIDQTDYLHINGTKKLPRGSMIYDTINYPLYSQAFRWFREKYGLIGWIEGKQMYGYRIESTIPTDDQLSAYPFRKYEEAELECLKKLIEIIKQIRL